MLTIPKPYILIAAAAAAAAAAAQVNYNILLVLLPTATKVEFNDQAKLLRLLPLMTRLNTILLLLSNITPLRP